MNLRKIEEYLLKIMETSNCLKRKAAIIIKNEKEIVAEGANYSILNCLKKGYCYKEKFGFESGEGNNSICQAIHAEIDCLESFKNYKNKKDNDTYTMYCTNKPCDDCIKKIEESEVSKVFYLNDYPTKYDEKEISIKLEKVNV